MSEDIVDDFARWCCGAGRGLRRGRRCEAHSQHGKLHWDSYFFFSSRRRHTRFDCDWSSDVCSSDLARPPVAAVRIQVLEADGDRRVDPYYWLRDRHDPEVIAYLEAENAYTDAVMAGAGELQERLYHEIVGRVQETDSSAATLFKGWWTYTRTVEGLDYEIYCRRRGTMAATEEVILDANELAKGHDYFELGYVERSPDESLLAYTVDINGSELHELRCRDLKAGQDLGDIIHGVYYGAAWAADNTTFFYVRPDPAMRPYQVWRHRLGAASGQDVLVFQEDDERFEVGVESSKSERYIFITTSSQVSSETHFLRSEEPAQTPILIEPRRDNIEYAVDDQEGRFLYLTNDGATNFRLMAAPTTSPSRPSWTELVPERPSVRLNFTDVHQRHVVLGQRSDGLERLEVLGTESGRLHVVDQPDVAYTAFPGSNPDYSSRGMRFFYTSLTAPWSAVDYDMDTPERTVVKEQPVRGGYDRNDYVTERLWASSHDGVQVPISVVFHRDMHREHAPLLLNGYGAYEPSSDPMFDPARLSLLGEGFVFAFGHCRGGGERGRRR